MENKPLQHGGWLPRKEGDGTSPPAPLLGGSGARHQNAAPGGCSSRSRAPGVWGAWGGLAVGAKGVPGGETFLAQPQLHLPGVGSPQLCDRDPTKVWDGKMCNSQ